MCLDLPVTNTDLQASYGSTLHCITHVQNSASFELTQSCSTATILDVRHHPY